MKEILKIENVDRKFNDFLYLCKIHSKLDNFKKLFRKAIETALFFSEGFASHANPDWQNFKENFKDTIQGLFRTARIFENFTHYEQLVKYLDDIVICIVPYHTSTGVYGWGTKNYHPMWLKLYRCGTSHTYNPEWLKDYYILLDEFEVKGIGNVSTYDPPTAEGTFISQSYGWVRVKVYYRVR